MPVHTPAPRSARRPALPRRPSGPALFAVLLPLALACAQSRDTSHDACPPEAPALATGGAPHALRTVFVIVMENQDWSDIAGNPAAPYVNGTLLPAFAHALDYRTGGLHPSLGNYVWLEAGDPLGIHFDAPPADVPLPVTCHLATYLEDVGLTWKAYAEGIAGDTCPLVNEGTYAVRHDPFVYFEDVSGHPFDPHSARCIAHVRPFEELASDLAAGTVPRYSFIIPDVCDDGHDACPPLNDPVAQQDAFLAREVPAIMDSAAYRDGGVILVVWDEGHRGDHPIGLIAVSPLAKPGYAAPGAYTHGSTVRTVQEILGVTPLLRTAASSASLSDLFTAYP
ncbi:phosphoesterase [Anaeromyxobacter sp. K]|uniref:alkaline phosphatase family protein n=1 Tax=Anaeromyxobacter sp. (strain K) TaxID=447217 RepID=UPI00017BE43F|nr:alkaline phosphatase family protein [Anaeromyxobacter sp. K]ACG74802.1 phosphoesterase [Anaeromyxobacter sp. K]